MQRCLCSSRGALARVAAHPTMTMNMNISRRAFSITSLRSADLVQDLYLKELKAYKPAPLKASDAEAHVTKFAMPPPPTSPEESNLAADLKAYEDQRVEVEGETPGAADAVQAAQDNDWFELEEDEEQAAAAH